MANLSTVLNSRQQCGQIAHIFLKKFHFILKASLLNVNILTLAGSQKLDHCVYDAFLNAQRNALRPLRRVYNSD